MKKQNSNISKSMSKNQQNNNNTKISQSKLRFLGKNLLLKQTLMSTWKNKLQLVILLLLSTFAVALITGTYVSYQRIVQGAEFMGINEAKFDAVLPYANSNSVPINQIANQAFSLHTGRLYFQKGTGASHARYFDDTIIGQQTLPLQVSDLNITYNRDGANKINSIASFNWANNHPITFNLKDPYVKASMYGQLKNKANTSSVGALQNHYERAAEELYDKLFWNISAPQMLNSLNDYFRKWISTFSATGQDPDNILGEKDDNFTNWMLVNKINFRGDGGPNDLTIPFSANLADSATAQEVLTNRLVQEADNNPRITYGTQNYGLNGQWMQIYRTFDNTKITDQTIIGDFANNYRSPSNYNVVTDSDGSESYYSYTYAAGAAALQNRDIKIINQFTGTAFVKNNGSQIVQYDVRVIDLGIKNRLNQPNVKIFEGVFPSSRNEIVISPQYARISGIKPGDSININNRDFIVSGIGGDALNIYPTFNQSDPVPNTRTQFLIYTYPDAYHDGNWYDEKAKTDNSLMYFLPWKDAAPKSSLNLGQFDDYFQKNIFSTNGLNDISQYDYSDYLIHKYVDQNHPFAGTYTISPNLVITSDSPEFVGFNQGFTLYYAILSAFKWGSIAGVLFILLIVCFITYLIVKKAIQKAQVSIGILKSSGYTTFKIAASYLAYPLIALVIAIPLGWFIGLALQVYFTEIFNTLFVLPYNVFNFNIIPALIAIGVIIGFILITSLATAYQLLQKSPLMLIKKDSDIAVGHKNKIGWLQSKVTNNFRLKFLLSLTKTSWKKILITGSVIGLATLAITATVSIPATISQMKTNYFKSQKYQNYYQYQEPIPNMPLSKYGLHAWTNLENPNNEPYYPVSGIMPWAENLIINDKTSGKPLAYYNPLEYEVTARDPDTKKPTDSNFEKIINFYGDKDENLIKDVKQSLLLKGDNGPLSPDLITWNYSWLGGRGFSNQLVIDLANEDKSLGRNFSNSLINLASSLLPDVIGVPNPGGVTGIDAISKILQQVLPGYVRQILNQKARENPSVDPYKYFSIGHNSVSYDPVYSQAVKGAAEELVTQFKIGSADNNLSSKGLLDVVGINPHTNMLTIAGNLVNQLQYSDKQTQIPMIINRAFASQYNLGVGDQFQAAPDVNTLYYKDKGNNYQPIPKENWYYGTDPNVQTPSSENDAWNRSANKWNARGQVPITKGGSPTAYSDSYGYNYNGVYDQNGKRVISKEPQEWNDTNKLWLKLPDDINGNALSGSIRKADKSTFNFNDLKQISDATGKWIKPFSFDFTLSPGQSVDPARILTDRLPEWYQGMLDQGVLQTARTLENKQNIEETITKNMPIWWKSMTGNSNPIHTYKIIGIQDSYDTARAFVDQKWANSILGYSYLNDTGNNKDPMYGPGIYQWFSGKMSTFEDIYDAVGRLSVSFSSSDYTIYGTSGLNGNNQQTLIRNADLLSRKKQMFDKMSGIAFSASAIFIITTILCSIIIVIMITDLFTDQFRRFMALMKSEGYSNWEINSFTLGIFTPWVICGYLIGFGLGVLAVFTFLKIMAVVMHIVLPFTFIWWLIPFSLLIIGGIYISTFLINNQELNKMNLIDLLKSDE